MGTWNTTFLQALGWSTLNSIWQMAFLWAILLLIQYCFSLSSAKKYVLAVTGVFIGFAWYIATFLHYFVNHSNLTAWQSFHFVNTPEALPILLNAASVTYLLLLSIPVYRVISNWRFIQKIKTEGLDRAHISHRLFTDKISRHLGIKRAVKVYISSIVHSPITVGFLKPFILLPVAAVNHLSMQQIEAILLHEMAHIRRHDYLLNLLLTGIHVILYFNPFIKAFLKRVEAEREACCDELVLQFEYDKVAYASALLTLEQSSSPLQLAMAAANKNNLLHRIEKIIGMPKKRKFETAHFAGAFAGLLMLLAVNSLIISDKLNHASPIAMDTFSQPSSLFMYPEKEEKEIKKTFSIKQFSAATENLLIKKQPIEIFYKELFTPVSDQAAEFMYASFNENANALAAAEKIQVSSTVTNTRKILESQWKEVETAMADGLTTAEKVEAKEEYLNEVASIDWEEIEKDLQSTYQQRDWSQINNQMTQALTKAKLDSIETECAIILSDLHEIEKTNSGNSPAIPDVSLQQITNAKAVLKKNLEAVRKAKTKKVVHL